jgi:WD40 repeat protein
MSDTSPTRTIDLLEVSTTIDGKVGATGPSPTRPLDLEERFDSAVDAYEVALDESQNPDRNVWFAKYPEVAERLAKYIEDRERLIGSRRGHDGPSPPSPRDELTGQRIGDYELLEIIGIGGQGEVWKAHHTKGNFLVALKLIRTGPYATASQIDQFVEEGRLHAGLDHPHIIPIYHVGEHGGLNYFTMKLAEAGTLKSCRGRFSPVKKGKTRSPAMIRRVCKRLARLISHVAEAVHHAHQYQLLHCDLKPGNILIHGREHAYVADFGLAMRIGIDGTAGPIGGTAAYMAPEQARGNKELSTAVDVYGLGAILYEMLTGRPPFQGETVSEVLQNVLREEVIPPCQLNRRVPRDLESICLKCLKKNPKERFRTAHEVAKVLNRFVEGKAVPGDSWSTRATKLVKRRPATTALVAAVFLVTALGGGYGIRQWQRTVAAQESMERLAYANLVPQAEIYLREGDWHKAEDALARCPTDLRNWEWHYLKQWSHAGAIKLVGHTDKVTRVAIRPDGRLLVSGSRDGTVRLWDPDTGDFQRTLYKSNCWVTSLSFSGDGRFLVTAGADLKVRVWDAYSFEPLNEPFDAGMLVAINHQGSRLAVAGRDNKKVGLWEPRTGRKLCELENDGETNALAFSPDGSWLAVGGRGKSMVQVWNMNSIDKTYFCVPARDRDTDWVNNLAFSPDSKRLAVTLWNKVRMWNIETPEPVELGLQGFTGQCTCVAFSPDSTQFVTSFKNGDVKVWDAAKGSVGFRVRRSVDVADSVTFTPDGQRIVYAQRNMVIIQRYGPVDQNETAGRRSHTLVEHASGGSGVAFCDSGRMVYGLKEQNAVAVRDVEAGRDLTPSLKGLRHPVTCVAISRDGRFVAAAGGREILVWDLRNDTRVITLEGERHSKPVTCLAFNPDGKHLASASEDTTVKIWNVIAGKLEDTIKEHKFVVRCVAFSSDGRLAAGCDDYCIRIWDAALNLTPTFFECGSEVRCITFSRDGTQLASASDDERVRLWDLTHNKLRVYLQGHKGAVRSVTFRPDGRRVASAARDGTIRIWDSTPTHPEDPRNDNGIHERKELLAIPGDQGEIACVAFSPCGHLLASAGSDVRIWDGRPLPGR